MPSEFELIRRHFTRRVRHTDLGVGDDAALFTPAPGMQIAVSTDMLVAGTHFLADTDPCDLGWKTLAVNVSDIAAMGAQPRWALLALSLPQADEEWIEAFARGLFECADAFDIDVVGGDTTRGPLNLCITILGEVPHGQAITRNGAKAGDEVWITGEPGRAATGLAHLQGRIKLPHAGAIECINALQRPIPRLAAGHALRGVASAMLDVSDGLLGDLGHILEQSGVGAEIDVAALPLNTLLELGTTAGQALQSCLSGGDDYELLFSAHESRHDEIARIGNDLKLNITHIGRITTGSGILLREPDGKRYPPATLGYDHFT